MNYIEAFQQGARCGHGEFEEPGGDTEGLSYDAACENVIEHGSIIVHAWAKGYQIGYILRREGHKLPLEFQYPVDRKPESWA